MRRAPDAWVRDVAVAGDLVRGVDDQHPLAQLVGQHARSLAQHGGLAHAGPAEHQHALARLKQVADDRDRPMHSAAHSAGQADHLATPVADGRDPVQRARDAGAVVFAERTDPVNHVVEIILSNLVVALDKGVALVAELGAPAEIKHDLDQIAAVVATFTQRLLQMWGEHINEQLERRNVFHCFGQSSSSFV
jgi:hypothetical protein